MSVELIFATKPSGFGWAVSAKNSPAKSAKRGQGTIKLAVAFGRGFRQFHRRKILSFGARSITQVRFLSATFQGNATNEQRRNSSQRRCENTGRRTSARPIGYHHTELRFASLALPTDNFVTVELITDTKIHTYYFDNENGQYSDFKVTETFKSSRAFTTTLTTRGI